MTDQEREHAWADATRYTHRIRNAQKRAYAESYAAWRFGQVGREPHERNFPPLSYMGAQAVRIQLEAIADAAGVPDVVEVRVLKVCPDCARVVHALHDCLDDPTVQP